jgi:hypothetical protein
MQENSNDNNTDWAKQTPPEFKEEPQQEPQSTWNPNDTDEEQITGLQKFLNISLIAHEDVAKEFAWQVKEGNIDPIQAFIALKRVGKINELCLDSQKGDKELKELILGAVRKSLDGGKTLQIYGADLRIQNTGITYDFTECGDSYLMALYAIQDEVKEAIKNREDTIKVELPAEDNKTLGIRTKKVIHDKMPTLVWNEDEIIENINPPIKRSGESVICTFKKK